MTPERTVVLIFLLGAFFLGLGFGIAGLREVTHLVAGM